MNLFDVGTVLDGTNAIHGMSRMGPPRLKHSTNDQRDMARLIPDTKYVGHAAREGLNGVNADESCLQTKSQRRRLRANHPRSNNLDEEKQTSAGMLPLKDRR